MLLLAALSLSAAPPPARGDVRIESRDRAYVIRMSFDVEANADQVRSVLTDYRNPGRLSSAVRGREIISQQGGVTRVSTELRGCAVFFCKTMKLVQDVSESDDSVRADVVPDGGDFRSGYLLWSIAGKDSGHAHVDFEAVMEPGFFVPPLIGDFLIRSALQKHVSEIAQKLAIEAPLESAAAGEQD